MKNSLLFKTLIDILFFLLCFGLLGIIFLAPMGFATISMENTAVEKWDTYSWFLVSFSIVSYVLLLVGIKYLRSAARFMLNQNKFHPKIANLLKKSGQFLILSAIIAYCSFVIVFIKKLFVDSKLEVIMDNNGLLQLFISIVGLFFIMQSEVLKKAASYKQENDLTI